MEPSELIEKLKASRMTHERIAGVINVDRTAVTRMLAGKRQVKSTEIKPLQDLLAAAGDPIAAVDSRFPANSGQGVRASEQASPALPDINLWPRDFPVVGTALGADMQIEADGNLFPVERTELHLSDIIDYIRRPPLLAGVEKAYALYIVGSSMEPRYDAGDSIYVDPRRPPSIGDHVVVQLRDGNGHDGEDRIVCALVKRLVRRNAAYIELAQYNPALTFKLPMAQVAEIHRVVPWGEVVGR